MEDRAGLVGLRRGAMEDIGVAAGAAGLVDGLEGDLL